MKIPDTNVQRERWLSRPLCRRYAAVAFGTISKLPVNGRTSENRTIYWAFGSLINGESEILGAWSLGAESAIATMVFGDLHNRGVEFLRCGLGNLADVEAAFLATFRMAALYPSIEQTFAAAIDAVKPSHRVPMSSLLRAAIGDPDAGPTTVSLPGTSSEELRQKYPQILQQWGEAVAGFQPLLALPEPYRQLVRSVDQTAIGMQERLTRSILRHGPFIDSAAAFDFVVDALMRADLRLQRDAEAGPLARGALVSRSGRFASASGGAVGTPAMA